MRDEDSEDADKAEKDKEAKEKEAEEKAAGEKAKAAARAKLIEQLGNLAKFVGSAADDAAVTSRAAQVAALIGDFAEASETEKAQILAALGDASAGDSAEAKKGAAAILKALGV